MKIYTITGPLCRFHAGAVLALTDAQVKNRRHCLSPAGTLKNLLGRLPKGMTLWAVEKPVEFKRAEVLGVDGTVNKALLADLAERGAEGATAKEADPAGKGKGRARKKAEKEDLPPLSEKTPMKPGGEDPQETDPDAQSDETEDAQGEQEEEEESDPDASADETDETEGLPGLRGDGR